jgi:hypothetical protein
VGEITFALGEGLSYSDHEAEALAAYLDSEHIHAGLDLAVKIRGQLQLEPVGRTPIPLSSAARNDLTNKCRKKNGYVPKHHRALCDALSSL